MCPIFHNKRKLVCRLYASVSLTYLLNNSKPLANFIQSLTQSDAIVSGIHLCESKQGLVFYPDAFLCLLNPVASDGEVSVRVRGLPCITGQIDLATGHFALLYYVLDVSWWYNVRDLHWGAPRVPSFGLWTSSWFPSESAFAKGGWGHA